MKDDEPYQISTPLYVGVTTPEADSEVPHWHPDQAEAYVIMSGSAEMVAKRRWSPVWRSQAAVAGDLLLVQPEVCHWFRWRSPAGMVLVFKAPQRAGVGRFPAGKTVCASCPHFGVDCEPPAALSALA